MLQKTTLLLFAFGAFAQTPNFDGIVDEDEWRNAQRFSISYEIEPADNGPAQHATEVFVTHTETNIYMGFIAFCDMKNLRSSLRSRDNIGNDDNVAVGFDPYGDGRYMIVLGANPEGSQFDFKILPNGNQDDYDLSYETKASKHDNAYHVEFKIPVSGLQFKADASMSWPVVFARGSFANNTRIQMFNFPLDRSNPCVVCQTPDRITLDNIKSKKRANLIPYTYIGKSGYSENNSYINEKLKGSYGLSGLFDLSDSTTLEFALNPDFSQVEADVSQINANNTFALFFPERRPFFNEGNDMLNSNQDVVYTRSINNPIVSTKLIQQGEKQRLYWLTAYDENAPYLVAGENESYSGEGGAAWANIFSYQRTFKGGSHIGILTTNRFFHGGGNGQLAGINSQLRFAEKYTMNIEWNISTISEPNRDWIDSSDMQGNKTVALDGENKKGNGLFLSLDRNTKNWNTFFYYSQYSPNFEAPIGFVTQNNSRNTELIQQYQLFSKSKDKMVQQFTANMGSEVLYNYGGTTKYFDLFTNLGIVWKGNWQTRVNIIHLLEQEYEGFVGKGMTEYSMFNSYNPSEFIRIGAYVSIGEGLRFDEENPAVGRQFYFGTFNRFQPTPKISIRQSLRYSQMRSKVDNTFYYKGYIARLNINYQFNNDFSFRLIGEYNEFDDNLFLQPLLKWNPNPFTLFFIGGSVGYKQSNNKLELENNQFYMKFRYLFDL